MARRPKCAAHGLPQPCFTCVAEGRSRRDDAVDRVDRNANDLWKLDAYMALFKVAKAFEKFTSVDVWAALSESSNSTHEPRAMGPIMLHGERMGWIAHQTPRVFVPTPAPSRHCAPIEQWESRILKEQQQEEQA